MALRVAFFGLPLAACLLLRDGHELALAVLSPIEGPGRRRLLRTLAPTVPVVEPSSDAPNGPAELDLLLARCRPDLIVSWFWTRRLTSGQLATARLGAIGAHPSLLPRHRGPNPYFAALDSGDSHTGVTIHRLTERYDEGAILAQESLPIGEDDAWQLARRLDRPSLRQLRQTVARLARGEPIAERPQDERLATWAPEPAGELLHADFSWPTERVLRRVRALSPVPGLALEFDGLRFFALVADAARDYPRALLPGEGALVGQPPELVIRTGDGAIRVLRAQLTGEDERIVTGQSLAQRVAKR